MQHPQVTKRRLAALFAVPACALLALAGWVIHLQCSRGEDLSARALRQQQRRIPLPARPGNIFAKTRGGYVLLAGSRQAPYCFADPVLLGEENFRALAAKLAPIVNADADEIHRRLIQRRHKRFIRIARNLETWQVAAIGRLDEPAVGVQYEWRRHYPQDSLAAHVLGHRQIDDQPAAGMELQARQWLAATDGFKIVSMDAGGRGRYAKTVRQQLPVDGKHVVLTIDAMVQGFLAKALAETVEEFSAEAGMGVVMDPNTGEILAMASAPSYDPNLYWMAEASQRRNRVITDPYEPGSVFKPIIAAGAVQLGVVTLETEMFCHNGEFRAPRGGRIGEFSRGFGKITLAEGLFRSSNIYMAKLGLLLGKDKLYRIGRAYDFGRATGVELPGECPGRLVPVRRWTSYATPRMPFGQGPIMVTNLQLARAFCVIANGGELLRPRIIDRVIEADGTVVHRGRRQVVRRVLDRSVCREIIDKALVEVVANPRGTGKRARLEQWRLFGKTGTAQIGGPGGYEEDAYTATFAAGAPADRPTVVCVISIYRPQRAKGYTGGRVAAPCVKKVLASTLPYLDVAPHAADDEEDSPHLAGAGGG